MPTFYVLDHKGVIRNKGFLQPDEIRTTVDALLKEMPFEAKRQAAQAATGVQGKTDNAARPIPIVVGELAIREVSGTWHHAWPD